MALVKTHGVHRSFLEVVEVPTLHIPSFTPEELVKLDAFIDLHEPSVEIRKRPQVASRRRAA